VLKEAVRAVFTKVLELLIEAGYVKLENYFVDGSKVGANAHAHKVVWVKKTKRYKEKPREQIKVLLDEIEQINEQENQEYGEADLEEMGGQGGMSSGKLQKKVDELNEALQKAVKKNGETALAAPEEIRRTGKDPGGTQQRFTHRS
jgi:hypothetical protein